MNDRECIDWLASKLQQLPIAVSEALGLGSDWLDLRTAIEQARHNEESI